jgi:hypothetical protein
LYTENVPYTDEPPVYARPMSPITPTHDGNGGSSPSALITARIHADDRAILERLALRHDRSPSREVRRAVRFYIRHYEIADAYLRQDRPEMSA